MITRARSCSCSLYVCDTHWQCSHHSNTLCCVCAQDDLDRLDIDFGKQVLLLLLRHYRYSCPCIKLHRHCSPIELHIDHDGFWVSFFQHSNGISSTLESADVNWCAFTSVPVFCQFTPADFWWQHTFTRLPLLWQMYFAKRQLVVT